LLSDPVRCDSPVDSNGCLAHFLKFEVCQTAIIVSSGLPHPTHAASSTLNKIAPDCYYYSYLQRAVTSERMGTALPFENIDHGFFSIKGGEIL
jgi:hypothetical protein